MTANSGNPDQTAHLEQSDLGLHCLPKGVYLGISDRSLWYFINC